MKATTSTEGPVRVRQFGADLGRVAAAGALAAAIAWPGAASAVDLAYTTDADFDAGTLTGVNHDAPNNDQLQLGSQGNAFGVMWIANAGEDSVSKIDTNADCEISRYETWFRSSHLGNAFAGPAPSRTAVDGDGNVYVANRHFDGRPASVMKILADGFIDRNGNGVADTSVDDGDCQIDRNDPAELIRLLDNNPANGIVDAAELLDERVAWLVQVGPNNGLGRSLCIAPDGNIWLGLYNARQYYELDPNTGAVLQGPVASSITPYGCLVDGAGILYSANLGSNLGILDTNIPATTGTPSHVGANYGIALGNGRVYLADRSGRSFVRYNPLTGVFDTPAAVFDTTYGISVDGNGDIVLGRTTIRKFRPDGSHLWSVPNPAGFQDQRGVIPDQDGNVWVVNKNGNTVTKFRGTDGAFLGTVPVGNQPYTYSDANGSAFRSVTNPQGTWEVIADAGAADASWSSVVWNTEPEGDVPAGAVISVEVRAGNANPPVGPFVAVANGGNPGVAGQFLQVRTTLRPNAGGQSPVLSDLRVSASVACDVDGSGQIDIIDIRAIMAARNTPAGPGDPRDADGSGTIDANDARQCTLLCAKPRCAP